MDRWLDEMDGNWKKRPSELDALDMLMSILSGAEEKGRRHGDGADDSAAPTGGGGRDVETGNL